MSRFLVHDVEQRSPEWIALRVGRLTGSRAADMLAVTGKGQPSTSRRNLLMQLVLERLTGRSQESSYQSPAMLDGIAREPAALATYQAITGELVSRTGFLTHSTLLAGCSLDGHLGDFERIVEAKSPIAAIHWEYLRTGRVPDAYQKQILHALWLTGAQGCDWLSFHPEFPERLQVKLVQVARDEAAIAAYERQVLAFLAEVDVELDAIATLADPLDRLRDAAGVR